VSVSHSECLLEVLIETLGRLRALRISLLCAWNAFESRSEPNPNIKGKRSFVPKIWKSVTFCDILWHFQMSQCHTCELCDISRFLSHGMFFFIDVLAKPKMSKKRMSSQMSRIRSLYRALFRRSAKIYVLKLRFAVVWLEHFQNLDTGHVYVLSLESGSERLWNHVSQRLGGPNRVKETWFYHS